MPRRTLWQGRNSRLGHGRGVTGDAHARTEQVARASYGRLVGLIAARNGDIAAAEDALSEALVTALRVWPAQGVPRNPEAWLLTVARNRAIDSHRRDRSDPLPDEGPVAPDPDPGIPDPRLGLMFACAHPAIDAQVRTPLILQTVLGFDAASLAPAFVLPAATLAQQLVRAKRRIKANAIPFRIPEPSEMPARLDAVLEAVYGTFALTWLDTQDARDMRREAVFLAVLLADLLPDQPEAQGLAALVLHIEARHDARFADGEWVALLDQAPADWDAGLIARADGHLTAAAAHRRPGRFQLEAAIQSVHAARAQTGRTDWGALAQLYEGLMRIAPTLGAAIAQAAVQAELDGPRAGLARLDALDAATVAALLPFWATRAEFLSRLGRIDDALAAYDRAIALCPNPAQRRWLMARRGAMGDQ